MWSTVFDTCTISESRTSEKFWKIVRVARAEQKRNKCSTWKKQLSQHQATLTIKPIKQHGLPLSCKRNQIDKESFSLQFQSLWTVILGETVPIISVFCDIFCAAQVVETVVVVKRFASWSHMESFADCLWLFWLFHNVPCPICIICIICLVIRMACLGYFTATGRCCLWTSRPCWWFAMTCPCQFLFDRRPGDPDLAGTQQAPADQRWNQPSNGGESLHSLNDVIIWWILKWSWWFYHVLSRICSNSNSHSRGRIGW